VFCQNFEVRVVRDVEGLRHAEPSVRHHRDLGYISNAH
jgi:GH43 family beta-xylosidase